MTFFPQESLKEVKSSIMQIGQMLHNKNMLAACDGNISFRFEDRILITKTGSFNWGLSETDFAVISLNGDVIEGTPSSEIAMHLAVYNASNGLATSVIHAHPVNAIALSIAKPLWQQLPNNCISELVIAAGIIPIVPYQRPGSKELADEISKHVPERKMMILSRHGALAWGSSLLEAYFGIERLEHSCEILLKASSIGDLSTLNNMEMAELLAIRESVGNITI